MKALIIPLIAGLVLLILSTVKPTNTIKDLKEAYKLEGQTAYQYQLFANKARDEGYNEVAKLFTAVSKSEEVQMKNQLRLLHQMGENSEPLNYETVKIESTKKNLKEAIRNESRDEKFTYLQFALDAKKEKNMEAKEEFIHSMNGQLEHKNLFKRALKNLGNNTGHEYYISNKTGAIQVQPIGFPAPQTVYEEEIYVKLDPLQ
jgi:rubrerythrin